MSEHHEQAVVTSDSVLLFSGGLDSTALAAIYRPQLLLFVDYGQRPADLERRASRRVAELLDLRLVDVSLGISAFGSGLLREEGGSQPSAAPSPEWWPYRNQFLATAGAAVALQHDLTAVMLGSVAPDGERHLDGTAEFYTRLDALTSYQEGGVHVIAPGIHRTTEDLLRASDLDERILGWTASCHRSNLPCGQCPGCWKRVQVLAAYGVEGYEWGTPS
ncbi:7-cyano-7-deazaguanine synthase [Microbacterium fluvii]|uniref:7-cyano-7-deazaguanine synthase n=1 Tax=Microbacterium fluvii TaxID=415215 RepID=A0ABW2HEA9_9MICO|nr:7-cyano-7-deazaguanine synthase [Microbacterium fluvii]MCU4671881.1 7-cyano-7-deazaguanine synthase [Microbacterium fluvii]